MSAVQDRILKRVRSQKAGACVFTPKDFLDLGSRASVDQGLSRLVKSGALRRIGRGLYDLPRLSAVLDKPAPASLDAVVDAVRRRFNVSVAPSNLAAANAMGLTHAVPTRPEYVASRKVGDIKVGSRLVRFTAAGAILSPWLDTPAAPLVQALLWLHTRNLDRDQGALAKLRDRASRQARQALAKDLGRLPGWAIPLARQIAGNRAIGGP
jgi:hypothetical protein